MTRYTQLIAYPAAFSLVLALIDSPPAAAIGGPGIGCTTSDQGLTKSGTILTASGSQHCSFPLSGLSPRRVVVGVQRDRWFGWETMGTSNSGWNTPSFYSGVMSATYNCAGTGIHTFRSLTSGQELLGFYNPVFESITQFRTAC